MPEIHLDNSGYNVKIWKITENENDLVGLLEPFDHYLEELNNINAPLKRLEFLASRILLRRYVKGDIVKSPTGKPTPEQGFLSISHTKGMVALMLSSRPCGIDIEEPKEKILKIGPKFLHPCDDAQLRLSKEGLTKIWCVKESVYKIFDNKSLFFNEHIIVKIISEELLEAKIILGDSTKELLFNFIKIENYYLVCGNL